MKVGEHIRKAIDDWMEGELDPAMMHACSALDGTARKAYPKLGSNARFTRVLRESYDVFGPMGVPGIDPEGTIFPPLVPHPTKKGEPDVADIIYGIHRCCNAHGEELPSGYELIPNASGPARLTNIEATRNSLRLSDRVIFGLLAVAVLSPENVGESVPVGHYLTFSDYARFDINLWWGRKEDFLKVISKETVPQVKIDFSAWRD